MRFKKFFNNYVISPEIFCFETKYYEYNYNTHKTIEHYNVQSFFEAFSK